MSRDRSLKGFSNARKPWWISLLFKKCNIICVCVCVWAAVRSLPGRLSPVFDLCSGPLCSHSHLFFSFFSAHYVFVTSDAASCRFVWANCPAVPHHGNIVRAGSENVCLFCKTQQLQVDLRWGLFLPIAGKHFNAYAHVDRLWSSIPL